MTSPEGRVSPIVAAIRLYGPGHYTTSEAAVLLGISEQMLRRWMNKDWDNFGPTGFIMKGRTRVCVWRDPDIEKARDSLARVRAAHPERFEGKRGAIRHWSEAERLARRRQIAKAHYWREAAAVAEARGEHELAQEKLKKAEAISDELLASAEERRKLVAGVS